MSEVVELYPNTSLVENEQLTEAIRTLIYEYEGRMPLAVAVGILEVIKAELLAGAVELV